MSITVSGSTRQQAVVAPRFVLETTEESNVQSMTRKVMVPSNRVAVLKRSWKEICTPIVTDLLLDVRYNISGRCVELRTNSKTRMPNAIDRANDFIHAITLGFEVQDAMAFLKMDNLYIDSFDITNVRLVLKDDNLSRAIGRIAGSGGKVKFTIENASKTRIVLADKTVHILGTTTGTRVAKDAICDLILGLSPNKVYQKLKLTAGRLATQE
ncbi:Partner of Nob1 [Giardia muris]|uniref:Partner of Nob1 n=1 Tax=Giardia muris TaxID=5742 RepID=A0A4Z1SRG0_GIAMU|nr:Partner of Nob1 [Giardia muris]|eukprot:TNJ28310.1 Partner of Nob1 [Giardia muris]